MSTVVTNWTRRAAVVAGTATLTVLAVLAALLAPSTAEAAGLAGDDVIQARWVELGGDASVLGPKLAPPNDAPHDVPGGRAQDFTSGSIYWATNATKAWEVLGAANVAYLAAQGPAGPLGFPTAAPQSLPAPAGATSQVFTGGEQYSSPSTGTHVVSGPVLTRFVALGRTTTLGMPTSDETAVPGGTQTAFENGRLYRSATAVYLVNGAVLTKYLAAGGPAGALGFPTRDVVAAGQPGSRKGTFAHGHIYWSSATGAHTVAGAILTRYLANGGSAGFLRLPTSDETAVTSGRRSTFQGGHVYWSSATGGHSVRGAILSKYVAIGATASYVGLPTTEEFAVTGGRRSRFRFGYITWLSGKGTKVTGTWRPSVRTVTAAEIPFTYRSGCPVGPASLRRVKMPFYDWNGIPKLGDLIVRTSAADDMERVFNRAFNARFNIRQIRPVDVYKGDDIASMAADNTSAFNCRKVTGNPLRLSQHSYGNAIDINTFENPYVTTSAVFPAGSGTYLNRSNVRKGMIIRSGPIARGMAAEGWLWGARWAHPDYQHFSSNGG